MKKVVIILLSAFLISIALTSCKSTSKCAAYQDYEKYQRD